MNTAEKTCAQVLAENQALRQRNAELEMVEAELKRTDDVLRQERNLLRRVMDTSPVGISIVNPQGQITFANERAEQVLGLTKDDITARTYNAPIWRITDYNGQPFPNEQLPFVRVITTRQPVYDVRHAIEWPDGRRVPLSINAAPIFDATGSLDGMIATIEDVTAKVEAERKLQESEIRFHELFENMPSGVAVYTVINHGADFIFKDFNKAGERIDHDRRENLLGKSIFEVRPGVEKFGLIDVFRKVWATGEPAYHPISLYAEGSLTGWYENFVYKLPTGEIVAVFDNITERKQAEEQIRALNTELEARVRQRTTELERANRDLQDFIYLSSHDLKTPLRGIAQLAAWLVADYAPRFDAAGQQQVHLLINRVKRMDNLLNGMLEYVNIGRVTNPPKAIHVQRLVHDVIARLAPPPQIQVTVAADLPVVIGERQRLEQVFQHLLSNAVNFMDKPEGAITVTCQNEGTWWRFAIADNGPGIDPKYHDKIFRIFQTLSRRDERDTIGIGLAIVKKIVELSGGQLWVESAVGQGSTFFFTLPKIS